MHSDGLCDQYEKDPNWNEQGKACDLKYSSAKPVADKPGIMNCRKYDVPSADDRIGIIKLYERIRAVK
jgi:hypothetical protein